MGEIAAAIATTIIAALLFFGCGVFKDDEERVPFLAAYAFILAILLISFGVNGAFGYSIFAYL